MCKVKAFWCACVRGDVEMRRVGPTHVDNLTGGGPRREEKMPQGENAVTTCSSKEGSVVMPRYIHCSVPGV